MVILVGAGLTLYANTEAPPIGIAEFRVSLLPGAWRLGNYTPASPIPTVGQLQAVLSALDALYLSGDWVTGNEAADLDNVVLSMDGSGVPFCFGNGLAITCPSNNAGSTASGCANSASAAGSSLRSVGLPAVGADTLILHASCALPNQPGLFFQGQNAINGGNGVQFGDGLRCAGGNVVRLEVVTANATGSASSTVPIAATGSVSPGDIRRYQWWYRDPTGSPCGTGFNLSNGLEVMWAP